jgi:hypothetical protein
MSHCHLPRKKFRSIEEPSKWNWNDG